MDIGAAVRRRRKDLGLTLQQVVDLMDMEFDTGNLSRAERGQQEFTRKSLESVARALQTTVAALYGEEDHQQVRVSLQELIDQPHRPADFWSVENILRDLSTDDLRDMVEKITSSLPADEQLDLAQKLIQRARASHHK